jgi:hypothetical protein
MWRLLRRDPHWRILMLRTFDFAVKGAANKAAQVIALGRVGIAVAVTRDRVALGVGLPTTALNISRALRLRQLLP